VVTFLLRQGFVGFGNIIHMHTALSDLFFDPHFKIQ
jgi:hypothetical protein